MTFNVGKCVDRQQDILYRAHHGFEAARSLPDVLLHGHSFKVVAASHDESIYEEAERTLTPYNYSHLNDITPACTDLALAMRLCEQLPNISQLNLQSAPNKGVFINVETGNSFNWLSSYFEAAHYLPNVPEGHKCGRLHGHGFGVCLHFDSTFSINEIENKWGLIQSELTNVLLNDLPGLENPTSEQLAKWLWERLDCQSIRQVSVQETYSAGCSYDGHKHQIWKQQNAESALYIPDGITGRSYLLKLHLQGQLDEAFGWVVDYSDIKDIFKPIYSLIDHHDLHTTFRLDRGNELSCVHLLQWIKEQMTNSLPLLMGVEVIETPQRSTFLTWAEPHVSIF